MSRILYRKGIGGKVECVLNGGQTSSRSVLCPDYWEPHLCIQGGFRTMVESLLCKWDFAVLERVGGGYP